MNVIRHNSEHLEIRLPDGDTVECYGNEAVLNAIQQGFGQAGSPTLNHAGEEPLLLPVMNFGEEPSRQKQQQQQHRSGNNDEPLPLPKW